MIRLPGAACDLGGSTEGSEVRTRRYGWVPQHREGFWEFRGKEVMTFNGGVSDSIRMQTAAPFLKLRFIAHGITFPQLRSLSPAIA